MKTIFIVSICTVLSIAIFMWFPFSRTIGSLLTLVLGAACTIIVIICRITAGIFIAKKPLRRPFYRGASSMVAVLLCATLVISSLSLILPITAPKEEPPVKESELWISIGEAGISNTSLKAPFYSGGVNTTLSLMGECSAEDMEISYGDSGMYLPEPYFRNMTLATTYLDADTELLGTKMHLSLLGDSALPSALTGLIGEDLGLDNVTMHAVEFSADLAIFDLLRMESYSFPLGIKAGRGALSIGLGEIIQDVVGGLFRGEIEIEIRDLELENGSFVLRSADGEGTIRFDSAVIGSAIVRIGTSDIWGMIPDLVGILIIDPITTVRGLFSGRVEVGDMNLKIVGSIEAVDLSIEGLRFG